MRKLCLLALALLALAPGLPLLHALDKQPPGVFHARRVALAGKLQGGVAILFAAEEPLLDFMPTARTRTFIT